MLVGNISSERGQGGCKLLLIQTPPSMTLDNWIGGGMKIGLAVPETKTETTFQYKLPHKT